MMVAKRMQMRSIVAIDRGSVGDTHLVLHLAVNGGEVDGICEGGAVFV